MSQGYERKTTKEIKTALQAEFPGVKFSVTKGRGTASHWVSVRYVDGPPETVIRSVTPSVSSGSVPNGRSRRASANARAYAALQFLGGQKRGASL